MNKDKMMMIGRKAIEYAGCLGTIIVPILAAATFDKAKSNYLNKITMDYVINYDDVVKIILDSGMTSSDKRRVVNMLKIGKEEGYYRTFAHIVQSGCYTSSKLEMIEDINSKIH